jgi:hypothetical protein
MTNLSGYPNHNPINSLRGSMLCAFSVTVEKVLQSTPETF